MGVVYQNEISIYWILIICWFIVVVLSLSCIQLSDPMDCSTYPSLSLGVCSDSRSLIRWCYQTISSSAASFSFCLQSLPSIRVFSNESSLHIKTQMVGKIEGRRRRGQQRMRWLDGIISSMDMNWANSRKQWGTGRHGMLQSMELHTTLWTRRVGLDLAAEQQKHSAYKLNKQGDHVVLLSQFWSSQLFHVRFCYF